MTLPSGALSDVVAWGHPWHGIVRRSGSSGTGTLTRDIDGGTMAYRQPSNGHTVIYAPGRPSVTPTAAELTAGIEFRNYAIISGDQFYGKRAASILRCITQDDLGQPWGVRVSTIDTSTPLAGGSVTLEIRSLLLANSGQPDPPAMQTLNITVASWGQDDATYWLTGPYGEALLRAEFCDASRDGRSVLLMLYNPPPPSIGGAIQAVPSNASAQTGSTTMRYPCGWVRIDLAAVDGIFSGTASVAIPRSAALGALTFEHSPPVPLVGECYESDGQRLAVVSGDMSASMSISVSGRIIAAWFDASGSIQTTVLNYSDSRISASSRAPGPGYSHVGAFMTRTRDQVVVRSIISGGAEVSASYEFHDSETQTEVGPFEGYRSGEYHIVSPVGTVSGTISPAASEPDFVGSIFFDEGECPINPPVLEGQDFSGFFSDERKEEAWRVFFCVSDIVPVGYNTPSGALAYFGVCRYTPTVFGFYSQQIQYTPPNGAAITGGSPRHYYAAIGRGMSDASSMVNNTTALRHASDQPVSVEIAVSSVPGEQVAFV